MSSDCYKFRSDRRSDHKRVFHSRTLGDSLGNVSKRHDDPTVGFIAR